MDTGLIHTLSFKCPIQTENHATFTKRKTICACELFICQTASVSRAEDTSGMTTINSNNKIRYKIQCDSAEQNHIRNLYPQKP
jgi:hypothetical protein